MIVILYVALLSLLYMVLSVYVIRGRFQHRLSTGDGGIPEMTARIRAHANFNEYVPLALILLFLVNQNGLPPLLVHGLGVMLLLGRVLHAVAMTKILKIPHARQAGMGLTLTMIILSALILLWVFYAMHSA